MIACLHDWPTQNIVNGYTGISLQYLMLFCVCTNIWNIQLNACVC